MKSVKARVYLLAGFLVLCTALLAALQTKVYDPTTGKETPQAIVPVGDASAIIWLFDPNGKESKAVAAVEAKGRIEFLSSGIVSGEDALVDLRFFDPPDYNPSKPGKWQKISKSELVQGRVIVTLEDGSMYTIYKLSWSFSGLIEPGRVLPEPAKPAGS